MPIEEGAVNLHAHAGMEAKTLIILLHGLGGHAYRTWGNLPGYLFDRMDPVTDIAVYDYRSGLRLLWGSRGNYDHWVPQFVEHFRELAKSYEAIFLVGHSQGGKIAEDAARILLQSINLSGPNQPATANRENQSLAALIFLASPRAGATLVSGLTAHLLPTLEPLRLFGPRSVETEEFYSSHVERQNTAHSHRTHILPAYAAIAGGDQFVSTFSAAHGIPSSQRKHLSTTHTKIAKPSHSQSELVQWICQIVSDVVSVRAQRTRDIQHTAPVAPLNNRTPEGIVIAELQSDPSGSDYGTIFLEECAAASNDDIEIVNGDELDSDRIDVLLAAHDAERFLSRHHAAKQSVDNAHAKRLSGAANWAAIYPVGPRSNEAGAIIEDWLASKEHAPMLFVKAVASVDEFREDLARALAVAVTRKSAARRNRVVNMDQMSYLPLGGE
ncbi:alpha/beta hydrolase [Isoptericola sp. NPDC056578]|uniref:alpha/beta hydrolase n=1 Tax=Isoptericola sp. NPDC056578 TaxID=3345870 RepID=UPI0036BACB46